MIRHRPGRSSIIMPQSEKRYGRRHRMVLREEFPYESEIVGCEWSLRGRRITFDYFTEGDPPLQVHIHFDLPDFEARWRGAHKMNREGSAELDGARITVSAPLLWSGERMTTIEGPEDVLPHVVPCSIIEQAIRWRPLFTAKVISRALLSVLRG